MKIRLHHQQPKLSLHDLLRRRKMTFSGWLLETGVSTYAELQRWCGLVGISPPTEDEWTKLRPVPVSAPADGVVVLSPVELPKKQRKKPDTERSMGPQNADPSGVA